MGTEKVELTENQWSLNPLWVGVNRWGRVGLVARGELEPWDALYWGEKKYAYLAERDTFEEAISYLESIGYEEVSY